MGDADNDEHAEFFEALQTNLLAQEGVDRELTEILSRRLIKSAPSEDCVNETKADILRLAQTRAAAGTQEAE